MPKALWKGSLACGLLNIPVEVYPATKDKTISFHMVHSQCGTKLKYKRWCPKCQKDVSWGEIDRGYPITKDRLVVLKEEELEGLELKTIKTIEIKNFVPLISIDSIYFASNYYLSPGDGGEKAYSLLSEVLSLKGKAAVGKVVIHNKEHVVAIRPYRKGLVMTMLYYPDEVLDIGKLEKLERLPEVGERERELAKVLVDYMSGEFRPEEHVDTYRQAVMELIRQKAEGIAIPAVKPVEVETTVDLMKALEASVKAITKKPTAPT